MTLRDGCLEPSGLQAWGAAARDQPYSAMCTSFKCAALMRSGGPQSEMTSSAGHARPRARASTSAHRCGLRTFSRSAVGGHLELSVLGVMVVGEDNSTPDVN